MQRRLPVIFPISQPVPDPYEDPLDPEVSTDIQSVEESSSKVLSIAPGNVR